MRRIADFFTWWRPFAGRLQWRTHNKWCGLCAAAFLLLLMPAPAGAAVKGIDLPGDKECWYAIRWDSQLVGYTRYRLDRSVELGGEQFYVINSACRIKLGMGESNDVAFQSKLLLNRATLYPSLFICRQIQASSIVELECLFSNKLVAQKNRNLQPHPQELTTTVNMDTPSFLIFNNVWGRADTFLEQYMVVLSAWRAAGGKEDSLSVYDPVMRGTESLHVHVQGTATVQVLGHDQTANLVTVENTRGEPLVKAYLSSSNGQILRLDDMHVGLVFTLSDAHVEALAKKAVGVNMYKNRVEFSNVYFPNANGLRNFKALVDVRLSGKPFLSHDISGYKQSFEGDVNEGVVKGTVDVSSASVTVREPLLYPRRQPFEGQLAPYVAPESGVESQDDEMHSKASEVAWRSRTFWDAARKINAWVHDNVVDGYGMPSGRYALQHLTGNSESKALLVVSMLRSVNVPARKVGGILFTDGNFVPHSWVEVYVGEKDGWVALDPSTGEEGTLGATHVALWENGDLASMDVKVLDYQPHPPQRVAFFNKELAWPVGQQRVYSILHGGKEIGKEIAGVRGLTSVNGKDAYQMDFQTDFTISGRHVVASSRLVTDPNVLPLQYSTSNSADGHVVEHSYDFAPNVVKENVKVGDDLKVQETPLSEGTYVVDPRFLAMYALVIGQIPNPGLGTKAVVNVYDPETHNSQDISLQIRQEEKIGVNGEERDTWRCESTEGVSFYIDKKSGQVVRIEQPRQDLVLQLVQSAIKI